MNYQSRLIGFVTDEPVAVKPEIPEVKVNPDFHAGFQLPIVKFTVQPVAKTNKEVR